MALQDVITIPPEERNRESGIPAVGAVPWGTHLCSFYDTKQDLIDILVPYFKAGLESNESCIWVTSELLSEKEAKKAMTKAVPDFAQYLERGQIEIIPHTEWYLKDGAFSGQRVLNAWIDKLDRALARGYDGMRITGNTSWIEKKDWKAFTDYEEEVDNVIGKYHMLAICTYSLGRYGASEVIDVMSHHQSTLTRQAGDWILTRSSERKQSEEALREFEEKYRSLFELSPVGITTLDMKGVITSCNPAVYREGGYSPEELVGKHFTKIAPLRLRDIPKFIRTFSSIMRGKIPEPFEVEYNRKDGTTGWTEIQVSLLETGGRKLGVQVLQRDITERQRIEEKLQASQSELFAIYDNTPIIMILVDQERRVQKVNYTAARFAQRAAEEMIGLYGGEALRCIHSTDDLRGCGFGRFCEACPVRQIVLDTFKTGKNHYRVKAKLQFASRQGDVTVLASTILLNPPEGQRVLVCIEDFTERWRRAGKQPTASPVTSRGPLTPLQARFVKSGFEDFTDREVMELLLSLCPGGMDMRQKERSLKAFKNIRELLSASPQQLREAGLTPECIFYLKLLHDIPAEVLREKTIERPVFQSSQEIFDYLYYSMRDLKHEVFKVIYLDKRDHIIDVVDLFEGTLDSIPIRPREIVETAIQRNTAALIFVHNHPTGELTASKTDKRLTRDLVFVGNILQIRVLDHIIIGENRYFSFADEGLIQKYEDEFLNIRIRRI